MPPMSALRGDPDGTREAIMQATYLALCTHGYADLTIERIGEEFDKSPSSIYHHYDGKDELLVDFLRYMLEHFEADVALEDYEDAHAHLRALLDHVVPATLDEERAEFTRAMTELRARAATDERYRRRITKHNRFFHDRIAAIVRTGIDQGVFRDIDPEQVAELLLTTINGAMNQQVTAEADAPVRAVRAELDEYVRSRLLIEGRE